MRLLAAFMIMIGFAGFASAQENDSAIEEITVSSITRTGYLYQGAMYYNRPVQQSDVVVAWRNGLFVSIWTSTGFNTTVGADKEIDFILGYSKSVGKFNFSTDAAYFALPGIDIANLNGEVGVGPIFWKLQAYAPVKSGGPVKSLVASTGARHSFALGKRFGLDLEGLAKYDTGAFGYEELWLAQGKGSLSFSLSEKLSLIGEVEWSKPLTNTNTDGRKREVVAGAGISYSFR